MKIESKANLLFIFLILGIAILYLIPLISSGFIIGHDSQIVLAREAARIEAIKDGQFPVRWAQDLNYGYGNPSFIFFYPLSGYLLFFFHLLTIPLETAYEILLGTSFIFAPIAFYFWVKQFLNKQAAFIGAIFYGLSPYLFLDVYVRAHIGESLSFVLIPAVLYFLEKNFKKITLTNILLGGISYALLIQTHVIMSFMFSFIFASYILLKSKFQIKPIFHNSLILFLGLMLSAYFWVPIVFESKFINSELFVGDWYKNHFLNISKVAYSSWGFGSNVNEKGGLAPQIGIVQGLLVLLSLTILKTKKRKNVLFWIFAFTVGIFMSTNLSSFLWSNLHMLQKFQFPWRFIALSTFSAGVLIAYVFSIYNNKYFKLVTIALLILTAIPMARVWKNQSFGDAYYFKYNGTATFHNEATTIWVAGDASKEASEKVEIISGEGKIDQKERKSNLHKFYVNAETNMKALDNTVYFPGWRVEIDGQKVPIEFQDPNHRGLITFNIPKGNHSALVKFAESPVRLLSDIISLIALIGLALGLIFRKWVKLYLKI